jgi:rubredoxin
MRKATWALLIWTALMLIWLIAGVGGTDCSAHGQFANAKESGCEAGAGIAAVGIIVIWFLGYIPLGIIWFASRPSKRVCPACGENVKKGQTTCPSCGHDFAAAATRPDQGQAATASANPPTQQVPAGWFPDPMAEAKQRYWDGAKWTDRVRGTA